MCRRLPLVFGSSLLQRIRRRLTGVRASDHYRRINVTDITTRMADGWKDDTIPSRQRQIVGVELAQMRAGKPPKVFEVAAEAVRLTGCHNPTVLEVGCSSGYYSEAIEYLLGQPVQYVGLD